MATRAARIAEALSTLTVVGVGECTRWAQAARPTYEPQYPHVSTGYAEAMATYRAEYAAWRGAGRPTAPAGTYWWVLAPEGHPGAVQGCLLVRLTPIGAVVTAVVPESVATVRASFALAA